MTGPVAWKVRSSDLFDRQSAVHIDASGVGLVEGLVELWRRVLSEGIRDSGERTFTDFDLSWDGDRTDAGTQPFKNHELARLRGWVYGTPGPFENSGRTEGRTALLARENTSLLRAIVEAHARLQAHAAPYTDGFRADSPAGQLRAAARASANAAELVTMLAALAP